MQTSDTSACSVVSPHEMRTNLIGTIELVNRTAIEGDKLNLAREQFARLGYTVLRSLLTAEAISAINEEVWQLMRSAIKREFAMPGYLTPRKLTVLGGRTIRTGSLQLLSLYNRYELRRVVDAVVGRQVFSCTHVDEFMVANLLNDGNDTHGWHLDDPAFAFVVCLEAPAKSEGGQVEFIPNWTDMCGKMGHQSDVDVSKLVPWFRQHGFVLSESLSAGDAYVLRADRTLHRVTPLNRDGVERLVLNLAFQDAPEATYGSTANFLYSA